MINTAALQFVPGKGLHTDNASAELPAPRVKSFFDVLQSNIYESPDMKGQSRPAEPTGKGQIENRQENTAAGFRTEEHRGHERPVKNNPVSQNDKKAINEKKQDKQSEDNTAGSPEKKGMVHNETGKGVPGKSLKVEKSGHAGIDDIAENRDPADTDIISMLKGLAEMLNSLADSSAVKEGKGIDAETLKQIRHDIKKSLASLKNNPDRAGIAETVKRVHALLEKLESALPHNSRISELASHMRQLRKVLSRSHVRPHTSPAEISANIPETDISSQVRDISSKIMNIIHSSGSEFSGNADNDRGFNSGSFLFQSMKNTAGYERHAAGNLMTRNSDLFREQLSSVIQRARVVVQDGKNGRFSMRLYPRELGNLNVNLGLEQGVIHGKFLVESQEAKTLLMENISHIREQLENAGVTVGEFQVNVRDEGSRFFTDREQNSTGTHLAELNADDAGSEYETVTYSLHEGSINMII